MDFFFWRWIILGKLGGVGQGAPGRTRPRHAGSLVGIGSLDEQTEKKTGDADVDLCAAEKYAYKRLLPQKLSFSASAATPVYTTSSYLMMI